MKGRLVQARGPAPVVPAQYTWQDRDSQVLILCLGTPRGTPPDSLYPRDLAPAPTVLTLTLMGSNTLRGK